MVALRQNQGSQNQVEKRAEFSVLTYLSGKKTVPFSSDMDFVIEQKNNVCSS